MFDGITPSGVEIFSETSRNAVPSKLFRCFVFRIRIHVGNLFLMLVHLWKFRFFQVLGNELHNRDCVDDVVNVEKCCVSQKQVTTNVNIQFGLVSVLNLLGLLGRQIFPGNQNFSCRPNASLDLGFCLVPQTVFIIHVIMCVAVFAKIYFPVVYNEWNCISIFPTGNYSNVVFFKAYPDIIGRCIEFVVISISAQNYFSNSIYS